MKNAQILAIAVVVIVVAAGASAFLLAPKNNDNGGVSDIITNDPNRITAPGGGRLWILGNANMDDVLDDQDVDYIQKIIDGKANEIIFNAGLSQWSETARMADANNDGVISSADIEKVKSLIAANKESPKQELFYVDVDGAVNMVHFPVKTIASTYEQNTKQLVTLNAMGMCDIVDQGSSVLPYVGKEFAEDNIISSSTRKDPEATFIIQKNPDIVVTGTRSIYCKTLEGALPEKRTTMDIVRISSFEDNNVLSGTLTLGFMIGAYEKGKEYVDWCDVIINKVEDTVSKLGPDQIVKVLVPRGQYDNWATTFNGPRGGKYETSLAAGAYNLIKENLTSSDTNVVVEEAWVKGLGDRLDQIVSIVYGGFNNDSFKGYTNKEYYDMTCDYYSAEIAAHGTVIHVLDNIVGQGTTYIIGVVYMAKWFYPTEFAEYNPDALFQDYIDKFMPGFEYNVAANSNVIAI